MSRSSLAVILGCLLLLLTGCLPGNASRLPSYPTIDEAIAQGIRRPVEVAHQEPFGPTRALVLFRTEQEALSATLVEQVGKNWRLTDRVRLNSELSSLGSLAYGRADVGEVEVQRGSITQVSPEAHVIFGESSDPAITWVELTLDAKGAQPIRTPVRNDVWAVVVPPEHQWTWFFLRAGDGQGQRFTASVNRQGPDRSAETAPLVAYQDKQLGLQFQHPDVGPILRLDQSDRLLLQFSLWTITMERLPNPVANPEEALLAKAEGEVLEHNTQPLNDQPAGYLLETLPDEKGDGTTYHLRYLIPAGDAAYAITCTTAHIYSRPVWETYWRPVCERVLTTLEVGE